MFPFPFKPASFTLILFFLLGVMPLWAKPLPEKCQQSCISTYGKTLGKSPSGVEAYSNCNSDCVVFEPAKHQGTYTGIKWQCVEYARRWLLVNNGTVYGDVDVAADIWNKIDHVKDVKSGREVKLIKYANGAQTHPKRGDLVVYAREYLNTGHVAIVTEINTDKGWIRVAEQNLLNQAWPADYARQLKLIKQDEKYWLLDPYVLGWKRPGK